MMAKAMYTGIRILQLYITPVAILWGGWEGLESPLPPKLYMSHPLVYAWTIQILLI